MTRTCTCGRCEQPTIVSSEGLALESRPHAEGVYRPTGGTITPLDAVHAYYGTGPAVGYRVHRCPALDRRFV